MFLSLISDLVHFDSFPQRLGERLQLRRFETRLNRVQNLRVFVEAVLDVEGRHLDKSHPQGRKIW
jgi:hypothetical protein